MKKTIAIISAVLGMVLATPAMADGGVVFECVATNGKQVVAFHDDMSQTVRYSIYNKQGDEELSFTNTYAQMEREWFYSRAENFVGGELVMHNGVYSYILGQFEKDGVTSGSVTVSKGEKHLATLECKLGSVKGVLDSPEELTKIKGR